MIVTKDLDRELRGYLRRGDHITPYARGIHDGRMKERRLSNEEPSLPQTPHPTDDRDRLRY